MLGEVYGKMYLTQANRPERMAYFDNMVSEIFGGRLYSRC